MVFVNPYQIGIFYDSIILILKEKNHASVHYLLHDSNNSLEFCS